MFGMLLFKISVFVFLLIVVPVFSAVQDANRNEEIIEDGIQNRLKKEDDLSEVFNLQNYFQVGQRVGKFIIYSLQKMTNYLTPTSIKESIEHLKFPGSKFLASLVVKLIEIVYDVIDHISSSEFLKNPTQKNLHNLIFDIGLILTEHIHFLTDSLFKAAKTAFDTQGAKFDALDKAKLDKPVFMDILQAGHKLAEQISKGIIKLSSPAVRNTIYRFIVESTLPFNKEVADIVKLKIESLNLIAKDISRMKFVKEPPNWVNVNEFVVLSMKTTILNTLKSSQDISKILFDIILKLRGINREMKAPKDFVNDIPVQAGVLVQVIHDVLSYVLNIHVDKIIEIVQKTLRIGSRVLKETTEKKGVQNLHENIKTIGIAVTDVLSKTTKFAVEELHGLAVRTAESNFISQPPSWNNAKEYAHSITKSIISMLQKLADQLKNQFDQSIEKLIQAPSWFIDLVKVVIPKYYLEVAQRYGQNIASGLESISGPEAQKAFKEFVTGSGLPQSEKLGNILMLKMAYVHELASVVKRSKFFSDSPTVENLGHTILEAIKVAISKGLKTFSDTMAIIEKIL